MHPLWFAEDGMHSCCSFRNAPRVQWETFGLYSGVDSCVCSNGLWTLMGFELSQAGMDKGRCHVPHLQGAPRLRSRPQLPCCTACAPTQGAGEAKRREGHDHQVAEVKTRGCRKGIEGRRVDGLSCCDALGPALCMYR